MTKRRPIDGNEAVAYVSYRLNDVIMIYPITPSSAMGEWADAWSAADIPNLWGTVPTVVEMQSEAGVAGAVHGTLQTGALTTTYTASQGLLLMMPNMFKIAGELTPTVFHVAARSVAAQALSIFGDHSDVMATRTTGFGLLASGSVQEAHDFALISQALSLRSRIPFVHFFDGFRTSHEIADIEMLTEEQMRELIDDEAIAAHRRRSLSPERPVVRGTAQNPDVFFQARETVNPYYAACPGLLEEVFDAFAQLTGRRYRLFDYVGHPEAERVLILMGSGAETAHETVEHLAATGERVGLLKVRLYRPFDAERLIAALPKTVQSIAVLDRTKEPGAGGEPLYLDCVTACAEAFMQGVLPKLPRIVGGRYGLSSKEFTPAMVSAVFQDLQQTPPKNHFTIGIHDDVTGHSLEFDKRFSIESDETTRALFFGLGADGTVSANKNSIKIIGEQTDLRVQGYFVYDSRKSGSVTISHLRFGPRALRSTYLIERANFVACHNPVFLERFNVVEKLEAGGTFLLNTSEPLAQIWDSLPRRIQQVLLERKIQFYAIDGYAVAARAGLGRRINTVMQTAFFAISQILPMETAISAVKASILKSYGKAGRPVVDRNIAAVDHTLEHLHRIDISEKTVTGRTLPSLISEDAPEWLRKVVLPIIEGHGDELPVSAFPVDGTYPVSTTRWEKRNIALEIPVWDPDVCIECGKCAMVCPHAVIRIKVYDPELLEHAPATFKSFEPREKSWAGKRYTIQVAPEDCTGCAICVDVCPARNKSQARLKALNMAPQAPLRETERENWDFFLSLPELDRRTINDGAIKEQQVQQPLFEFSGACEGCGETPYIKLVTQLFGDRALIANATGCSSIFGGNLPTHPWTTNAAGRGPAWSNSLFEDNAEFGLGFRVSIDKQTQMARELLQQLAPEVGDELVTTLLENEQADETAIYQQRERVAALEMRLRELASPQAKQLLTLCEMLVKRSVWIIGGDGWAYDIGFGGLDHVLASGRNVNILVLDTEVYSNTGGQQSKATPRAAVAKFAAGGKPMRKKDLGLIAMSYGNVYVASVAMGAKDQHTLRAFVEAESYPGPSLIIAYSHCIAHGITMQTALQNQKAAVNTGQWLLYRYDPRRARAGEPPLALDSRAPRTPLGAYFNMENRFRMLTHAKPDVARRLFKAAQEDVDQRYALFDFLAGQPGDVTVE